MSDAAAPEGDPRAWRMALAVVAGAALIRLLFAIQLPLYPDEAYYWDWSRRLAAGYFDHPPGIAWSIAVGTAISRLLGTGASAFAVRLVPLACGLVASLAVVGVARRVGGDRAALYGALIISAMPLAATGLVLATPDAPLMAATGAGLYAVVRAVQAPLRSRESLRWWAAAGVALGLAFTSKYTSILLPVGVVLAVIAVRELRPRLREPGPYLACIIATLVFAPVLLWNAGHEWRSFTYQIEHGLGRLRGSPLQREGELIGGQAGLATPILFVLMAAAVWQGLRRSGDATARLLAVVAATMWGFFIVSAWRKPVEANWPAPAYIPAAALLASAASVRWTERGRRWTRWGIGLAAALTTIVYAHALFDILPLAPRRDPIARAFGFDAMAAALQRAATAPSRGPAPAWFGTDRYQDAAEAAFHLPGHPHVFSLNLAGRGNQYDLWPGFPAVARQGDDLVLALDEVPGGEHAVLARLAPHFAGVERGELVELRRRAGEPPVSLRRIWTLRQWRGGWPSREVR